MSVVNRCWPSTMSSCDIHVNAHFDIPELTAHNGGHEVAAVFLLCVPDFVYVGKEVLALPRRPAIWALVVRNSEQPLVQQAVKVQVFWVYCVGHCGLIRRSVVG